MKVLVTGSCGMLGTRLVKDLLRDGHIVYGIDINPSKISNTNYYHNIVDINDDRKFMTYLQSLSLEAIIHLAARTDLDGLSVTEYSVNFTPIITINKYITNHDIRRVIFTSTQLVKNIHDSDDEIPPNPYGASKLIAEKMIKNFDDSRYVVLRPTTIWGEGHNGHYRKFISYLQKGLYFHPSRQQLFKSYSYVGNASFQIIKLLHACETAIIKNKIYYLCDYSPIELVHHINMIAEGLSVKPPISLPRTISILIAKMGDVLGYLGVRAPFNTFRMNNITAEYVYDTTELEKITGELPFDYDHAMKEFIQWLETQK